MLKIKKQLNYRQSNSSKRCLNCEHLVMNHPIEGLGGEDLGRQDRCKKIGVQNGRMYRIRRNMTCDAFMFLEMESHEAA